MSLRLRRKIQGKKPKPKKKISDFSFRSIGGYDIAKQEIRDAIVMPMRHPSLYKKLKVRSPKGILLWGPPGTGKTLFARTIAKECSAEFFHIRSSDIMSEWFGVSERRVKQLFQRASRSKPSIIFFDELESLAPSRQAMAIEDGRSSLLSSLLSEIDGFEPLNGVTILGATNIPNRLDPALVRPGRFDKMVYIPPPTKAERIEILKIHLEGKPYSGVNIEQLAGRTNLYTGADLELLVNTASTIWLKKFVTNRKVPFSQEYFDLALTMLRPSIRDEDVRYYDYLRNYYERSANPKLRGELSPSYYG